MNKLKWMTILSLGISVSIALYWTGYYLVTGFVPVISTLEWIGTNNIDLPFTISRWWDILLGPIFSISSVTIIASIEADRYRDWALNFAGLLIGGLFLSLVNGVLDGLIAGLISGLFCVFILVTLIKISVYIQAIDSKPQKL